MSKSPLISIITVNLNNLEGLRKTMKSVFEQSWQEFEYIIIDGGSSDGSREFIEAKKDKIDYWVSEPDKGIYNGMNKGIKAANGEYLLFLNSGDHFFSHNVLQQNYTSLINYDLVYFNIKVVSNRKDYIKKPPSNLTFSYFIRDTLPHQATFIKASLFKTVGCYDEKLKIVSDWKFCVKSICDFSASYLKVEDTLSTHYLNGLSARPENWDLILEERKCFLKSNYQIFIEDSRELLELRQKVNELNRIISNLRNSKKIRILTKLGLIKKI